MPEWVEQLLPNVTAMFPRFTESIQETLLMVGWSGSISFLLGIFFGLCLTVTKKGGILENQIIFQILDKVINCFRSVPFVILLTALMPLSRMIMGTAINVEGAIVPLIFGTTPFFSRQIESALAETDSGLIEAAQSMGSGPIDIIFRVYLKESIAPIARATTITAINLVGLTAMAGAVGAGGLGNFAIQYGHDRNMVDVTWTTLVVLIIIVSVIQLVGRIIEKRNTH